MRSVCFVDNLTVITSITLFQMPACFWYDPLNVKVHQAVVRILQADWSTATGSSLIAIQSHLRGLSIITCQALINYSWAILPVIGTQSLAHRQCGSPQGIHFQHSIMVSIFAFIRPCAYKWSVNENVIQNVLSYLLMHSFRIKVF